MDTKQRPRRRNFWQWLCRLSAVLYATVARSWLGRAMTAYRFFDNASLVGRYGGGRRTVRGVSRVRLFWADAVKGGWVPALLRAPFRALYRCPLKLWGTFGLSYGVFCTLFYVLFPLLFDSLEIHGTHWNVAVVMLTLSLPLLSSSITLAEGVSGSRICRAILVDLFCLPLDYIPTPTAKGQTALSYVAILLGLGAAVVTLFADPLAVPIFFLLMAVCGLVFTYPEAGVLLLTLLLPVVWLWASAFPWLLGLLLLTWASFGVKLFLLHRTLRFGFLDRLVLLFGGVVLLSGFVGAEVSTRSMAESVCLFACVSLYFLIVNLMNSRAYMERCLIGFGVTLLPLTLLSYVSLLPADSLAWLAGSRAGDTLISMWATLRGGAGSLLGGPAMLFCVLAVPFLYVRILRARRVLSRVLWIGAWAAVVWMMVQSGSPYALVCVAGETLIFLLFLGYRALATGVIVLPALLCGGVWLTVYLQRAWDGLGDRLSLERMLREEHRPELWRLVWEYPAGLGVGAVPDSGDLALELLHDFGWQGLILGAALIFFFSQKSITALTHAPVEGDRLFLVGGLSSVVGLLLFGASSGCLLTPAVTLTLTLLLATGSACGDLILDESDVLMAEAMSSPFGEDRIYRIR